MSEVERLPARNDEERIRLARVERIFETLPSVYYFNVVGIFLFGLGLHLGGAAGGDVTWLQVFWACVLQSVGAVSAFLVYRRKDVRPETLIASERVLISQQFLISLGWGLAGWLFWTPGCPANNVAIGMGLLVITWTMASLRAAIRRVFLVGVASVVLMMIVRLATSPGYVPKAFLVALPLWVIYLLWMAEVARKRMTDTFRLVFSNETLAAALRAAHDTAVAQKQEAEAANAAKSKFLANMSHELRTPLNAILGFSEIIAGQALGPSSTQYARYAQDIHEAGTHLLSLINDLLDVAKIEAGRLEIDPRTIDLRDAFEGAERLMAERAAAKQQSLRFVLERDTPSLWADERAVKQILLNLTTNAVKYTQIGGQIRVLGGRSEQGGVRIVVEDNGPGILPEKMSTLFKPFAQIDNRFNREAGGTGLGLSLVSGLVGLHKGHVWAESELGQGTKMFVVFPPHFDEKVLPRP